MPRAERGMAHASSSTTHLGTIAIVQVQCTRVPWYYHGTTGNLILRAPMMTVFVVVVVYACMHVP